MLRSAVEHDARQIRIEEAGVLAALRARFTTLDALLAVVTAAQVSAIREAATAVPLMLGEQGIDISADATIALSGFLGYASDGRPMATLLDFVRSRDVTTDQFTRIVATQLQDVARDAASVTAAATPAVNGYIRMVSTPCCPRCAVLAGRFYRWSSGFDRHPRCRCRHIPSRENIAGDLRTSPDELVRAGQVRGLSVADTKAIVEDGADVSQVINAHRGMQTAQVFGRRLKITSDGTTSRGVAGKRLGESAKEGGSRYQVSQVPRLRPESIYRVARDRDDAVRLLRRYGYVK